MDTTKHSIKSNETQQKCNLIIHSFIYVFIHFSAYQLSYMHEAFQKLLAWFHFLRAFEPTFKQNLNEKHQIQS